jgi:hypothetical protein
MPSYLQNTTDLLRQMETLQREIHEKAFTVSIEVVGLYFNNTTAEEIETVDTIYIYIYTYLFIRKRQIKLFNTFYQVLATHHTFLRMYYILWH